MFEVREVLRLWLAGEGIRATERLVGFDRKTVRRYVDAAVGLGLVRDGREDQLTDVFIGLVVEAVRLLCLDGRGESWRRLQANHDQIAAWVKDDLTAVKIHELLPLSLAATRLGLYDPGDDHPAVVDVTTRLAQLRAGGVVVCDAPDGWRDELTDG